MKQLNSIMLVDDDSTANFLHEEILNEMGIAQEIIKALNGEEALDTLSELCALKKCPDLILLDINMPKINGFEVVEKFHKMHPTKTPPGVIVMVTSSLNPADLRKARELGVDGYLSKPLSEEELNDILDKYFMNDD